MSLFCPSCNNHNVTGDFCNQCGGPLQMKVAAENSLASITQQDTNFIAKTESCKEPADGSTATTPMASLKEAAKAKMDQFLRIKAGVGGGSSNVGVVSPAINVNDIAEDALQDILPPSERERGWRIVGGPFVSPKGYEHWPVSRAVENSEVKAVFRRYTSGVITTKPTYEALFEKAINTKDAIANLYSYGTVPVGGGARRDYEIVAMPAGQPLDIWLKHKGEHGVDLACYLAPLLKDLLKRMQDLSLRPITLGPKMLWIDTDKNVITLGVLGAIAPCEDSDYYCPDLTNNALLTLPYAAPELLGRRIIASTTETFSVGQLLLQAMFGEPRDHNFIVDGSIPFAGVENQMLRSVLMGTLWPYPDRRWSVQNLNSALVPEDADFPKCPPWRSLCPGAAKAAFTLGGEDYYLPEDLLEAVVKHWDEALLRCDDLLRWLDITRFKGQAGLLRQEKLGGRSADWVFLHLRRLVLPDAPIVWRGYSFDDADAEHTLISLAQRALAAGEDARQAQSDLDKLFSADLRSAFTLNKTTEKDKQ